MRTLFFYSSCLSAALAGAAPTWHVAGGVTMGYVPMALMEGD